MMRRANVKEEGWPLVHSVVEHSIIIRLGTTWQWEWLAAMCWDHCYLFTFEWVRMLR